MQIVDAIISHGCFLQECSVQNSIVGERSRLDFGVELKVNYHGFQAIKKANLDLCISFLTDLVD